MTRASARKVPKQARAKATVEAIRTAASQVLVEEGYEKASTNRIAQAAGVSIGSLYQYFPDKDSIFGDVISTHIDKMYALTLTHIAELAAAPIAEAVRVYVSAIVEAHAVDPCLHRALAHQAPQLLSQAQKEAFEDRAQVVVRGYLEAHKDEILPSDLDMAAFILVTTVEAVVHSRLLHDEERADPSAVVDELCAFITRYLGVEAVS